MNPSYRLRSVTSLLQWCLQRFCEISADLLYRFSCLYQFFCLEEVRCCVCAWYIPHHLLNQSTHERHITVSSLLGNSWCTPSSHSHKCLIIDCPLKIAKFKVRERAEIVCLLVSVSWLCVSECLACWISKIACTVILVWCNSTCWADVIFEAQHLLYRSNYIAKGIPHKSCQWNSAMTANGARLVPSRLNLSFFQSIGSFLQTPDEKAAFDAVQLAFKQGINFFDVAPFYAAGKAEEVHLSNSRETCLKHSAKNTDWVCAAPSIFLSVAYLKYVYMPTTCWDKSWTIIHLGWFPIALSYSRKINAMMMALEPATIRSANVRYCTFVPQTVGLRICDSTNDSFLHYFIWAIHKIKLENQVQ